MIKQENNQIGNNVKSESLILVVVKSLSNSLASIKKHALSLLTLFRPTRICEQLFFLMNSVEPTAKNHFGTQLSKSGQVYNIF